MSSIETAFVGLLVILLLASLMSSLGRRWPRRAPRLEWSMGLLVAVASLAYATCAPAWGYRQILVALLSTGWGLNLTYWLHWRRFAEEREPSVGVLKTTMTAFLATAPQLVAMSEPDTSWSAFDGLAVAIFGIGLYASLVAHRQLRETGAMRGRSNPPLQTGVWALSRQPHVFGETLMVWSFFVAALAATNGALTLFAPLLLSRYLRVALDVPRSEGDEGAPCGAAAE